MSMSEAEALMEQAAGCDQLIGAAVVQADAVGQESASGWAVWPTARCFDARILG